MVARRSRLLVGIAVLVALLVPAASASAPVHRAANVDLALLPLQKAQLGRAGASLSLTLDSGTVPYYTAGSTSDLQGVGPGTTWDTQKLGNVTGYTLDYGEAFSGCRCVTEIRTSVDRYRSAAIAKKGLAYRKTGDEHVTRLNAEPGFAVDVHRFVGVPAVGTSRFAYLTEYDAHGVARRVRVVDEWFIEGRYAFQVEIHWGAGRTGITLASKLAQELGLRLHLALAGRLHATAVKIPAPLPPGPPPGGTDLSKLILQQGDLPPAALGGDGSFSWDRFSLSHYQVSYSWGAHRALYQRLTQDIQWHATANEAAFWSAYEEGYEIASYLSGWPRHRTRITSLRLDSIGRGDRATIMWFPGGAGSFAVVGLSRGHVTDLVFVNSNKSALPASDVRALARAMAARLDAAVPS
jgi:hypothetical protein